MESHHAHHVSDGVGPLHPERSIRWVEQAAQSLDRCRRRPSRNVGHSLGTFVGAVGERLGLEHARGDGGERRERMVEGAVRVGGDGDVLVGLEELSRIQSTSVEVGADIGRTYLSSGLEETGDGRLAPAPQDGINPRVVG